MDSGKAASERSGVWGDGCVEENPTKKPRKCRMSWQVDEMMASSLALHLPHAPLVSQGLATVAIAPAPAATVYVPPAVCSHSANTLRCLC